MKIIASFIALVLYLLLLIYSELIVYGFKQLKGQLKTIYYTENIESALVSPNYSEEQKSKIQLILRVKEFAEKQLGFRETKNFNRVCNQKLAGKLWVVEGCELFSFNEYTWQFPLLGEVSYKGYFDVKAAKIEAERLKNEGYDASIGSVSAWSTLGILNDPILSDNLQYKKSSLVNLIFHELFHSTYYAKSSVDINENLANFIAHKASLLFLKNDTSLFNEYKKNVKDDSLWKDGILREMNRLRLFYKQLNTSDSSRALVLKKLEFQKSAKNLIKLNLHNKEKLMRNIKKMQEQGNTFFCGIRKYDALYDSLNKVLKNKHNNDLKRMIQHFKHE